jgi:hypothetical protein
VKVHIAILFLCVAAPAAAERDYTPLPLAPETTEVACEPQPSDEAKLRKAIAFYIHPLGIDSKSPLGDGYFDASLFASVDSALAAQPDCCQLLFKDAELYGSERLKARLGDNFGGFVRIRFALRMLSGPEVGNTYYSTGYYVLDSCGNPVFDL